MIIASLIPSRQTLMRSIGALALGTALCGLAALAQKPSILSISVCTANGAGGPGSCPTGSFDTHQTVLGTDGNSINRSGVGGASDEHSSVFSPGTLGSNSDYLFFVASGTNLNPDIGAVVLSGGAGPDKNGQWTFDFAKADSYGSYAAGYGPVFLAPTVQNRCPTVADGNPAHQDQTYDLNYAAPGSVVKDPTSVPGSLLMIYEGTNTCFGNTGGINNNPGAYITLGVATSLDSGHNWPTYRGTPSFSFIPLPSGNRTQGPNAPAGALGQSVCVGTDCGSTPAASYGRYAVVSPPTSLASVMATGTAPGSILGDSQPAAFVDDASAAAAPYLYAVHGSVGPTVKGDLTLSRAQLNGGTAPLSFMKWNGQSFSSPGVGGVEVPILPGGSFQNCAAQTQSRHAGSIYYVEPAEQYLLVFVCDSPTDPAAGQGASGARGAAWFYSTSRDLSDPSQWSPPQEIAGSWSPWDNSGGCISFKGWYPTLMSLGTKPGHLSTSGYGFYLWGCEGGSGDANAPKRQFSSRAFTITTAAAPAVPQINNGGIVNNASYNLVSSSVAPGSIAAVFGSNLTDGSSCLPPTCNPAFGSNGKLNTTMAGAQVSVNGTPVPIFYAAPTQLGIQIPFELTGASATVAVSVTGQSSTATTAVLAQEAPGIFTFTADGKGAGAFTHVNGSAVTVQNPAERGELVILYATGLGQVVTAVPTGTLPGAASSTAAPVTLTIGGIGVIPEFAGLAGCCVGLNQINVRIPVGVSPGNGVPAVLSINGKSSNTATMAVQ